MHRKDSDGNHVFEGARSWPEGDVLEVYTFEKENYEKHEFRHRITDAVALNEIDKTIFDPDLITLGPKPQGKRNFYRVKYYRDGRNGERALMIWRAHCFPTSEHRYHVIATAFNGMTSVANAVHYLEKELWKKPGSKI